MRILILSQWFSPEPTLRGIDFAQDLADRGHEVRVVTGFPNLPGGRVYEGYRVRILQREVHGGVTVYRVPLFPSHDRSAVRRTLTYFSFAVSAVLGVLLAGRKADVAYVYHPPATIGLPALVLRYVLRVPYVYDVQDLWPDTLAATGMVSSTLILRAVGAWMRLVYAGAAHISVLSPGFKQRLIERGVAEQKTSVTYNWAPEQAPTGAAPGSLVDAFRGKFNVVYAGNMGKAQALDSVLVAARELQEAYPQIQFVLVGDGVEKDQLEGVASAQQIDNVVFLPRVTHDEIGAVLDAADVLLVHLRDDPLFAITIPSKTQAYLAAGKPIIMGIRGDAADLVDAAGAGVACEPENAGDIKQAVETLYLMPGGLRQSMGSKGKQFYESHLSRTRAIDRLETLLKEAAGCQD